MTRIENAQPLLDQDPKDGIELKLAFADLSQKVITTHNASNDYKMYELVRLVDGYNYLKHRRFWRSK